MRRTTAVAIAFVLAGSVAAAPGMAGAATGTTDPAAGVRSEAGAVYNILPPGSQGTYTPGDVAAYEATGARPANTVDQLEMYDALGRLAPGQVTDGVIAKEFKQAPLGVDPADVVSVAHPRAGVTILRDKSGVPHVYGTSYEDVAYGAGYAGTQDRMFLQDVLRHVGSATTAEFLGPSAANIAMDQAQLQVADYTPAEAEHQVDAIVDRYPVDGPVLLAGLDAFIAGINAAQQQMCPTIAAPTCPAEYAALQRLPKPFTRADIVYIASLVGGIFGKGGGGEIANAYWLERLRHAFGRTEAARIFADLRERNDPEAPTTVAARFPYAIPGAIDRSSVAMPDLGGSTAPGTGTRTDSGSPVSVSAPTIAAAHRPDVLDGPLGPIPLGFSHHDMSNALVVGAGHTASGHPIAVFGPQTGYFAPQLLEEIDLHGPGVDARGASFAGTQLVVELGHGVDYAWSATSADGDNVDIVADRLCNLDGSAPSVQSTAYVAGGRCVSMTRHDHVEYAVAPSAGGTGAPQVIHLLDLRTRHGIVLVRTTVHGVPAALVSQRSTYGHELDSAVGFYRVNNPNYIHSAVDFEHAMAGVDYTFNWFYVDSKDIAYQMSGRLPVRATGVDPDLPRWGNERWDWQGYVKRASLPHAIDPAQGYFANWNNKPAPGFSAADNVWGWGAVFRSLALRDRIVAGIANGGKMTRASLVGAMEDAATVDVRAAYLLRLALRVVGADATVRPELAVLRTWLAEGTHREDRDRDGHYTDENAIALFDAWYPSLARTVLRGTLGRLVGRLPQAIDDHPSSGVGSAFDDVAWYGYVSKDLRQVLGAAVQGRYHRTYCGGGSFAACRRALRASLEAAVARVSRQQGTADPAYWTYDASRDDIRSQTVGVVGVPPITWQNRPTFQQVVMFTRPR